MNSGEMTMDGISILAVVVEGLGIIVTFVYRIGRLEGKINSLCERVKSVEDRINVIEKHLLEK